MPDIGAQGYAQSQLGAVQNQLKDIGKKAGSYSQGQDGKPSLTPTQVAILSSVNPNVSGGTVVFTAAVAPPSANTLPTGTVTFTVGGVQQSPSTIVNGVATLSIAVSGAGNHNVSAVYSGDTKYKTSTSNTFVQNTISSFVQPFKPSGIDVTAHGLVGDNSTDNTSAFNTFISGLSSGALIYFPAGTYVFASATNNMVAGSMTYFGMIGDVDSSGNPTSILRFTGMSGNMLTADYGSGNACFRVQNLKFVGPNSGETAFYCNNAVYTTFVNCVFDAHIGLHMLSGFACGVRNCTFTGHTPASNHVGLMMGGPTENFVGECTFTGWGEAIRSYRSGFSMVRSTMTGCTIGLNLGVQDDGTLDVFLRGAFNSNTYTNCDRAVVIANGGGFLWFDGETITGGTGAPSGQSTHGFYSHFHQNCSMTRCSVTGDYSTACVFQYDGKFSTYHSNTLANTHSGGLLYDINPVIAYPTGTVLTDSATVLAIADADPVVPERKQISYPGTVLDVTAHGLVDDLFTDNAPALTSLIAANAPGPLALYFPHKTNGRYGFNSGIDFSPITKGLWLIGDFAANGGSQYATEIFGAFFTGTVFSFDYSSAGQGTFTIENMNIRATQDTSSVAVYAKNAVLSRIWNSQVIGFCGIQLVNCSYCSIQSVNFNGHTPGIGLIIDGGVRNSGENIDFMAWAECIRATGYEHTFYATRMETNSKGFNLGVDSSGATNTPLTNGSVAGVSMEANDRFIILNNCVGCTFEGIGTQGSTNAPSGYSQICVDAVNATNCSFYGVGMGGLFNDTVIRVHPGCSILLDAVDINQGGTGTKTDFQAGSTVTQVMVEID
jgi:hypothetical protein